MDFGLGIMEMGGCLLASLVFKPISCFFDTNRFLGLDRRMCHMWVTRVLTSDQGVTSTMIVATTVTTVACKLHCWLAQCFLICQWCSWCTIWLYCKRLFGCMVSPSRLAPCPCAYSMESLKLPCPLLFSTYRAQLLPVQLLLPVFVLGSWRQ